MLVSKTLKIKTPKLPPSVEFIEEAIKNSGIEPVRWAIVDVFENELLLSVSGMITD